MYQRLLPGSLHILVIWFLDEVTNFLCLFIFIEVIFSSALNFSTEFQHWIFEFSRVYFYGQKRKVFERMQREKNKHERWEVGNFVPKSKWPQLPNQSASTILVYQVDLIFFSVWNFKKRSKIWVAKSRVQKIGSLFVMTLFFAPCYLQPIFWTWKIAS